MKFLALVLTSLVASLFSGFAIAATGLMPLGEATGLSFLGLSCYGAAFHAQITERAQKGVALGITQELWVNYIIGNLFKDQAFLDTVYREDDFVVGGSVVHIPQAGAKPGVVKNRTALPAAVVSRTDVDILYPLDEYTSDPTLISNAEEVELSYDKMASVLGEHVAALTEVVGDNAIWNWLKASAAVGSDAAIAAAGIIRTTGSTNVAAHLPGATGNRKKFIKEDLKAARTRLNKQNIPKEDRFALFSSDVLDQLMDDADLIKRDTSAELDMSGGVIMRLYGFNVLERSSTATYDNAGTPVVKAPGAATGTADNDVVVCYQRYALAAALGTVRLFEDTDNPAYYGDIYSALLRHGSRKRRKGAEGVVAIVQAH